MHTTTSTSVPEERGSRADPADSRLAVLQGYATPDGAVDIDALLADSALGRSALVTSFGVESAVLLHFVLSRRPDIDVVFLETGKHFAETLGYRDDLVEMLGIRTLVNIRPDPEDVVRYDRGGGLHRTDPDLCCHIRKTVGLQRALTRYDTWISGRKRFQGTGRKGLSLFERNGEHVKINPLAHWSRDDIEDYFTSHRLPRHPLGTSGYQSIGCASCTVADSSAANPRAGRWSGSGKTECGIHDFSDARSALLRERLLLCDRRPPRLPLP